MVRVSSGQGRCWYFLCRGVSVLCRQKGLCFAVEKMSPLDKRQWVMLVCSWKGCGYPHLVIQYVFLLAIPGSPDLRYAETLKKALRPFLLPSSQMPVSQTLSADPHPLEWNRFKLKTGKCASIPWACPSLGGKGGAVTLKPHSRMLIWEGLQDPPKRLMC